jgi:hypothetical protein
MRGRLKGPVDDIDVQVERIRRLIDAAARKDPELAAGLGSTESMTSVQRKLDEALTVTEELDHHLTRLDTSA